jgi:Outer membrane protein (porin)
MDKNFNNAYELEICRMNKGIRRVDVVLFGAAIAASMPAFAQSSVTLYGIVDNGISYTSNQSTLGSTSGGKSAVKMTPGVYAGSRFGLKGGEDLGGNTKAIFQLESGFNSANGGQQYTNAIFGRQAWVGLTNPAYGTFTAGRQYASYYQLLSPYSPTTWITGYYGAHPGDIDGLDTIYRANNTLEYTSPKLYGLTVSGSYSLGGVAGSTNQGSTWSTAVQYAMGPVGLAVGFSRINNSTVGRRRVGRGFDHHERRLADWRFRADQRLPDRAGTTAFRGRRRLHVQ